MAIWEIRKRSSSAKGKKERKLDGAAVVAKSHLSASFPEKTEGLGMRASGRTWIYTGTSAGFCRVTTSSCRKTLNLKRCLKISLHAFAHFWQQEQDCSYSQRSHLCWSEGTEYVGKS